MTVPGGVISIDSTEDNAVSGGEPAQNNTASHCSWGNVGTYKDGSFIILWLSINGKSYDFSFCSRIISDWEHPVPAVVNWGWLTNYHPVQKLQQSFLAKCYLLQDTWFEDPTCLAATSANLILDLWATDEYYFNDMYLIYMYLQQVLNLPYLMTIILPSTPQRVVPFKHNFGKQCIPNFTLYPRNLLLGICSKSRSKCLTKHLGI